MISQITLWMAAGLAILLAARTCFRERASVSSWAFIAGLILLGVDAAFGALSLSASDSAAALRWYRWRMVALAFTPGVWLAFSVTYARGNYPAFLRRWMPAVIALLVIVPAIALVFHRDLLHATDRAWRLGNAGRVIHVFLVMGAAAVLMNVERTFRAAVGLMRWQLKFMVIGLATLFLVRVYTFASTRARNF
jgi:hypothetical protein